MRSSSLWIWGPWLDLLIGCGGWSAPLLVVAYVATQTHTQQWSFAFYFLALVFNYPHFMATVYRAYHTREQFEKYRIFTVHIAGLLLLAAALTHTFPALLPWLFTLYICWSPWHYSGQNFGLLMMFSRRAGIAPQPRERHALYAAFIASYVMLMLNFHTGASTDDMILSLGIPARIAFWPKFVCASFFLLAGGWALMRFAQRASSLRAMIAPFTLFASQFLWFVVFTGLEMFGRLQTQQTRYSTGMLAVLHSTQYLWITSYYQRREARATGQSGWNFLSYFVTLIAGGIALFVPLPWIVSRLAHVDFGASFLTFTSLVNIHHFILDGAIWKLRDTKIASLLIDSKDKVAAAVAAPDSASAGNRALGALRWLGGSSRGAHWVRVAAALLLCAWGVMDQTRYYWANVQASPLALKRAAELNPFDSSLLARIARVNQRAGDTTDEIAMLVRALKLNPRSRPLRRSLARALLTSKRYQDADRVYKDLLSGFPNDVEALVNEGLVQQRLGNLDEAMDEWNRAIAIDPNQGNAQLYLGDALNARGEEQAASRHYREYLKIISAHPEQHAGESHLEIGAIIKVADAYAHSRHPDEAMFGYNSAVSLAEKDHDVAMESLAIVHQAELQEGVGRSAQAAELFQRALAIDAGYDDPPSVAADWAEYGQFLRRHGQPERLSFACFLRAEELLRNSPGSERDTMVKLRTDSEARLGAAGAAAVRRQLDAALKEAASIPVTMFSH